MFKSTTPNPHEKRAQKFFTKATQGETPIKHSPKDERKATAAKTAKLRVLRLAKEAADKEETDKLVTQKADAQTKRPARRKSERKRAPIRMFY